MCLQDGPPITSFTAYAEISSPITPTTFTTPNIAQSPTYTCPVSVTAPTATCTVVAPPPGAATVTTSTLSAPPAGTIVTPAITAALLPGGGIGTAASGHVAKPSVAWRRGCRLGLGLTSAHRGHTVLRARLTCPSGTQPAAQATVSLTLKGSRRARRVATVALSRGRWRSLTLATTLHSGDRLTARVPANARILLPAQTATLTASTRLLRAAAAHR